MPKIGSPTNEQNHPTAGETLFICIHGDGNEAPTNEESQLPVRVCVCVCGLMMYIQQLQKGKMTSVVT